MAFKHSLGSEAESKVTKLRGILTSRSENLYGCNRYYIQPSANAEGKIPDGWWVDEDDITIVGRGLATAIKKPRRTDGGPMSKVC